MATPIPAVSNGRTTVKGSFFDEYAQGSNNPEGAKKLAEALGEFVSVIKTETLPGLSNVTATAQNAVAHLCFAVHIAKTEDLMLFLGSDINATRGGSFGAKLLRWVVGKAGIPFTDDVQFAWWKAYHPQMSSTIEMVGRHYRPVGPVSHLNILTWIESHGGMGKLHRDYQLERQHSRDNDRATADEERRFAQQVRKERAAEAAGFNTVEEHEEFQAKAEEAKRQEELRSRFDQVKENLIQNGTPLKVVPRDRCRLLVVESGQLYQLSEDDEYDLLKCAASALA